MVLLNSDPKIPSVGKIETHHPHFKSKPKITQIKYEIFYKQKYMCGAGTAYPSGASELTPGF